jgi:predicted nucleic-acid-binding protein
MFIIDTNYFVRSIVADDLRMTTEARNVFNKIAKQEIIVKCNMSVIFEVIYVLIKFYKYEKSSVYEELFPLLNLHNLIIGNKVTVLQTLKLFIDSNLDAVDCYLIIQAKNENLELLTFDKKCKNKLKEIISS